MEQWIYKKVEQEAQAHPVLSKSFDYIGITNWKKKIENMEALKGKNIWRHSRRKVFCLGFLLRFFIHFLFWYYFHEGWCLLNRMKSGKIQAFVEYGCLWKWLKILHHPSIHVTISPFTSLPFLPLKTSPFLILSLFFFLTEIMSKPITPTTTT